MIIWVLPPLCWLLNLEKLSNCERVLNTWQDDDQRFDNIIMLMREWEWTFEKEKKHNILIAK